MSTMCNNPIKSIIYDLKFYRAHIFNQYLVNKLYKWKMDDHLLGMAISKWADHENVTDANKLASPSRVN